MLILLLISFMVLAEDGPIEYWPTSEVVVVSTFDWRPYFDPKNELFWEEPQDRPARPVLETLKNPTAENKRNLIRWYQLKQDAMSEFANTFTATPSKSVPKKKNINNQNYIFQYYFSSKCPYCKEMFPEIIKLKNMGFYVELRQAETPLLQAEITNGLQDPVILKQFNITAYPTLLITNKETMTTMKLDGVTSAEEIISKL